MADYTAPTPHEELRSGFADEKFDDLETFRHCIGLSDVASEHEDVPRISTIAQELAKYTLLVSIDCEHYTLNSDEMTEIGIGVIQTEEAARTSQAGAFGDHGESIMKLAQFHLLRMVEKAHLPTTNAKSRGPEGNRFGESRFVTFSEARRILHNIMVQPVTGVKVLQGLNRPVVILGHSLKNDRDHLNGKDLAFDIRALGTVIREIDTQQITVDCKYWHNKQDPIGLPALVSKLGFEHTDAHTAANDAARTLMCGILMAIPKTARQGCQRSVQDVALAVEAYSQATFKPLGGTPEYCSMCGSKSHMSKACTETGLLRCDECVSRGLNELSTTHIALHCPIVRDEVADERNKWYKEQTLWTPKYPFSSRDRLQTLAPNAPRVQPATAAEVAERRQWYDKQRKSGEPLKPFVWSGRSFSRSPLAAAGPPLGSRPTGKKKG